MGRSVVVDANLALGLFLPLPYTDFAHQLFTAFARTKAKLYAPYLWEYECASGLRRAISQGYLSEESALNVLEDLSALKVECVLPDWDMHKAALQWAKRIGQAKAYDAYYLALAERLGAQLWSADQRLIHAARAQGATWVHWVGDVNEFS